MKSLLFTTLIILIIDGLWSFQIYENNELSTKGVELAKIEDQIKNIKLENSLLSEQLYRESSYAVIASKAAAMGFTENANNHTIILR
jgi:cell division protein FtsL